MSTELFSCLVWIKLILNSQIINKVIMKFVFDRFCLHFSLRSDEAGRGQELIWSEGVCFLIG